MRQLLPWAFIGALCFSCGGDDAGEPGPSSSGKGGTAGKAGAAGKAGKSGGAGKSGTDAGEAGTDDAGATGRGGTGNGSGGKGGTNTGGATSGGGEAGGAGMSGDRGTGGTGTGGDGATSGAGQSGSAGESGAAGAPGVSPAVAVIWPPPDLALNASSLRARAMVAGVDSGAAGSFEFNGATITGANASNVSAVRFVIDGVLVTERAVEACPQPFVEVDLALDGLAPGEHVLTVTSVGGSNAATSVRFELDPTLAASPRNDFENLLTPGSIECLIIEPTPSGAAPVLVEGEIILPPSSSWDPSADGLFLALSGAAGGIPAAAFSCAGETCSFSGQAGPFASGSVTSRAGGRRFSFSLQATSFTGGEAPFTLRTGRHWGGLNLGTLERQGDFRVAPRSTPASTTTIGPDGGVIVVSISPSAAAYLEVPPGALTRDTPISLTPVTNTTLAGTRVENGVELEPAGLVFKVPARLTLQFAEVREPRHVLLWTSPTTAVPLLEEDTGRVDLLTGYVRHFTSGSASPPPLDYFDWLIFVIDDMVGRSEDLTLDEISTLLSSIVVLQKWGEDGPVNLSAVAAKVRTSLLNYVIDHCPSDIETPTEGQAAHYYTIGMLAQSLGADVPEAINCADEIRRALCDASCENGEKCYAPGGVVPGECCKPVYCGDGSPSEPECGERTETDNCGLPIDCGECPYTHDCYGNYQCRPKPCVPATPEKVAEYAAPHPPCGVWNLQWQDQNGINWCAQGLDFGGCESDAWLCSTSTGANAVCLYTCDDTVCPADAEFYCTEGHCCDAASCLF